MDYRLFNNYSQRSIRIQLLIREFSAKEIINILGFRESVASLDKDDNIRIKQSPFLIFYYVNIGSARAKRCPNANKIDKVFQFNTEYSNDNIRTIRIRLIKK